MVLAKNPFFSHSHLCGIGQDDSCPRCQTFLPIGSHHEDTLAEKRGRPPHPCRPPVDFQQRDRQRQKSPARLRARRERHPARRARGRAGHSLICARLYSRKADLPLDAELLRQRLQSALGLRQRLYNQPWYRLCHGEGDLLPGLVMDRFGDHLTVQVGTWGMEARKEELHEVLNELLRPRSILWDNDIAARSLEGLPRENQSEGPVPDVLEVPENGCIFRAPLQGGQKTGWFYDQRRNRREAARYAAGADVLDIFCYAGGFGGTAAAAGARSVTFLDASPQALALATENAARNAPELARAKAIEGLCGDAFERLAELDAQGRRFSLICLDPPAFIKRRKDFAQGLAAYRKINALAMQLLTPGGVFVSCSCSHHLPA